MEPRTFLKSYANDPLIVPAVAPHAIYTNSDETLKAAASWRTDTRSPW